jgi:predicted pyridoxine 5'-phosphate oxidase superfamily flavin-nucleotide-binding protein
MTSINNEKMLRAIIPPHSPLLDKRVLSAIDGHCENYLAHSRCAMLALANQPTPFYALCEQQWQLIDPQQMQIQGITTDHSNKPQAASVFFWIPGVDHGLRLNGWLKRNVLQIEQVYLHCGRAAMRAQWWLPQAASSDTPEAWVAHARYGFLLTQDDTGLSQLSPRGEPKGGFLLRDDALWIPERPGNKYAISLRNVLKQPQLTVALMQPGQCELRWWQGSASIESGAVWHALQIDGRVPKLGLRLSIEASGATQLPELKTLWQSTDTSVSDSLTPFSKALSEHMSGKGVIGKLTHGVVNHIIERDKRQLY